MNAIDITRAEVDSGQITPGHLETAQQALRRDGYVLLNDLVDCVPMAVLREKMLSDTAQILARGDVPFNFNRANIQQDPPPFEPYLFREVLVNDIVIAITRSILGPGLKNAFYSGNTALPNTSARQPVHADMGHLWPAMETATPPYALVVNVFPVDVSPENGSTEIWPGTHTDTSVSIQQRDIKIPLEKLAERREIDPPFQPTARAGSVLIRDIRLWHAGMPNLTAVPRPMIAMIHWVSWWTDLTPLVFPKGSESFFEHPDLTTLTCYVDPPIEYLNRHTAFDLQK